MRTSRTGRLMGLMLGLIVLVAIPGVALADEPTVPTTIDIGIAPNTLNLSHGGDSITVHAGLAFTVAQDYSWSLEGVPAYSIFADDCGGLVAKFNVGKIATAIAPQLEGATGPTNVSMTLQGEKEDLVAYEGSGSVRVIDVTKQKGN